MQDVLWYEPGIQESKLDAAYLPILNQQIASLCETDRGRVLRELCDIIVFLQIHFPPALEPRLIEVNQDVIAGRPYVLHSV
jgi:hypothetical protein